MPRRMDDVGRAGEAAHTVSSIRAQAATDVSLRDIKAALIRWIDHCAQTGSRSGFFAASYLATTNRVETSLAAGDFEQPERVAALTVVYASRYLQTVEDFVAGQQVTRCWQLSLEADRDRRLTILQHLLLGMSAHINFDLAVAVADSCADESDLAALRPDFLHINALLARTLEEFQDRIAQVSPMMGLLDRLGWRLDERAFNFSIHKARDAAWSAATNQVALRAAGLPDAAAAALTVLDRSLSWLGQLIIEPGPFLLLGARAMVALEEDDVGEIIRTLSPAS